MTPLADLTVYAIHKFILQLYNGNQFFLETSVTRTKPDVFKFTHTECKIGYFSFSAVFYLRKKEDCRLDEGIGSAIRSWGKVARLNKFRLNMVIA